MQKSIFTVMIIFAVSVFMAGTFNEALAACTSPDASAGALNSSGGDWFKCDGSSWVPFEGGGGGGGGLGANYVGTCSASGNYSGACNCGGAERFMFLHEVEIDRMDHGQVGRCYVQNQGSTSVIGVPEESGDVRVECSFTCFE